MSFISIRLPPPQSRFTRRVLGSWTNVSTAWAGVRKSYKWRHRLVTGLSHFRLVVYFGILSQLLLRRGGL